MVVDDDLRSTQIDKTQYFSKESNENTNSLRRGVKSLSRWISRRCRKPSKGHTQHQNAEVWNKSTENVEVSMISEQSPPNSNTDNISNGSSDEVCSQYNSILVESVRGRAHSSQIQLLDESWEDWQSDYQKGVHNLSNVTRPTCFNGFGHMSAPLHRNESTRLRAMEKLNNMEIWNENKAWMDARSRNILRRYRMKSMTVSLLDHTTQKIMFEVALGYEFDTLGREMSIDAHTVLSTDYFALLDASSDWRTRLNPIVYGPPFIKFYLGVPMIYKGVPVGCVAILDPFLKTKVSSELVSELKKFSEELILKLDSLVETRYLWRNKKSKWREASYDAQSQQPYVEPSEALDLSRGLTRSRNDSDNQSYASIASSRSLSIFSTSQESLVVPFMGQKTRYYPISSCRRVKQPYEVFESLLKCSSIYQAIKKACRMVMQNIGASAVYIAEVRMLQRAQLGDYRRINDGECITSVEQKTTIAQLGPLEARAKLVGSCKPNVDVVIDENLVQQDLPLLRAAVPSKYGIKFLYDEPQDNQTLTGGNFCSGIMVPLRRSQPKFQQNHHYGEIHSGGFIMSALCVKPRDFSPGDCTFLKIVTQALENILTCYDEIQTDIEVENRSYRT